MLHVYTVIISSICSVITSRSQLWYNFVQGADVNARDNCGWLPLHEACNHGHLGKSLHFLKSIRSSVDPQKLHVGPTILIHNYTVHVRCMHIKRIVLEQLSMWCWKLEQIDKIVTAIFLRVN